MTRSLVATLFLAIPFAAGAAAPADEAVRARPARLSGIAVMNFRDLPAAPAESRPRTALLPETSIPHNLPVPAEVATRKAAEQAAVQIPFGATLPATSPSPAKSFAGLGDDGSWIPPDTNGAAGPNHLMETINSQVQILDRAGKILSTVTLDSFWSSISLGEVFDPRINYDPFAARWIVCAADGAESTSSHLLLGVSKTSDPTGQWILYKIEGDANSTKTFWLDRPSLGFNKTWIAIQLNAYNLTDNSFHESDIYLFDKSKAYSGLAAVSLISSSSFGTAQVPAITYDNTLAPIYLVQSWNGDSGGMGFLRLYSISGPVGAEVFSPIDFPTLPAPWDSYPPDSEGFAPQLGSTKTIAGGDDRIESCVFRNGSIWGSQTVFLPAGGSPTRSAVQWFDLTPSGSVVQAGRVDDPTNGNFYSYPNIAVNRNSDALVGFSTFSSNRYASCAYAFRAAGDPPGTLEAPALLKAGQAAYFKTLSGTVNRWGDYSLAVVDPANDTDFWTIQEYAASPFGGMDRWGTWWGEIVRSVSGGGCGSGSARRNCVQPITGPTDRRVGPRPPK